MRKLWLLLILVGVLLGFTTLADEVECLVEAFFVSPTIDHVIERRIVDAINGAEDSILIAMYSFTDDELGEAVVEAYQERGLDVRILLDGSQGDGAQGKEWPKLQAAGIPILVEDVTGLLHHKVAVIDEKLVITGSYNWIPSADEKNFENVVFIRCETIAQEYKAEFLRIWNVLGGSVPAHPLGQELFLDLIDVTSTVGLGRYATVEVETLPGASCMIKVRYKTGWSTTAGLYSKEADEAGKVSWTWEVGPRTSLGTWSVYVTAELNGETASLETYFTVTE